MKNLMAFLLVFFIFTSCKKDEDLSQSNLTIIDTQDVFEQEIKSGVSLVFFHATWCSICKTQRPAVEEASKDNSLDFVKFLQIDTDKNRDITKKYEVPGQPVILFMKDGQEKQRLAGSGHSQKKIKDILISL